jgi:sugar phosphate isomerase/epimerase
MELGLSSYAYRWSIGLKGHTPSHPMNVHEFVDRAIKIKLKTVQICDNLKLEALAGDELKKLKRSVNDNGVCIETGGRGTDPEYLKNLLSISDQLGARILRVVPEIERDSPKESVREELDAFVKDLRSVLGAAKGMNVRLALENHATLSSEEILYILKAVSDDFLGACLDTMNSMVMMEHPLKTVEMLAPYAISVHLKDFRIEKNPRDHRIIGTPLGEGFVDFQILKQYNLNPNLFIELYIDRKEDEEKTKQYEEECVRRSIEYARSELRL